MNVKTDRCECTGCAFCGATKHQRVPSYEDDAGRLYCEGCVDQMLREGEKKKRKVMSDHGHLKIVCALGKKSREKTLDFRIVNGLLVITAKTGSRKSNYVIGPDEARYLLEFLKYDTGWGND